MREALIFTGIRRDVPDILAASDCVVFPSTVPHFARPIIEAAAMGVPSVASNLGGPQELVADGETGLLVHPRDPAALAHGIAEILCDPARARAMGEAAYQRARRLFDGSIARDRAAVLRRAPSLSIEADAPLGFHTDGEPHQGGTRIEVETITSSLLVRVPPGSVS